MLEAKQETVASREPMVFSRLAELGHEEVVHFHDAALGLRAIVGIHNTVLGPAVGGLRVWDYAHESDALEDVLRLSRGMTYKSALAGLNIGGGKAVIIGDARRDKSEALLRRFGQFVHSLGGRYWTAADINIQLSDVECIRAETPYVLGLSEEGGGSGDPSPVTAYGVYVSIKAACKERFGTDALEGRKIAVQGSGKVGRALIDLLHKEGAQLWVSDLHPARVEELAKNYPIHVVEADAVYDLDVDVYAPCALGATLNKDTIPRLKCSIIAGAANNQLADEEKDMERLRSRDLLYAPDFLINAGGIINVYFEYQGQYKRELALRQVEKIYQTLREIFAHADKTGISTHAAALQLAQARVDKMRHLTQLRKSAK